MSNPETKKICRNCMYWDQGKFEKSYAINSESRFRDDFTDLKSIAGTCRNPKLGEYLTGAWADYDTIENHFADMTGPDFGCVHWSDRLK